jgi:hypothetical protein
MWPRTLAGRFNLVWVSNLVRKASLMSAIPTMSESELAAALDCLQSLLGAAQNEWDAIKDSGTEPKRHAAWAALRAAHTDYWCLKDPSMPRIPAQGMPPKRVQPAAVPPPPLPVDATEPGPDIPRGLSNIR